VAKENKTAPSPLRKPTRTERAGIGRVNEALRGPVVDVLLENIPAFHGLTRDQAFELVMNNPRLVEECFKLFRKRPDLFDKLILGPDGNPVSDEQGELACGRTLAEVVALVVRAAAKRHFQAKLGGTEPTPPAPAPPTADVTGWRRMLARFLPPPPPTPEPPPPKRKATRADRLYRAMQSSLLYEWQLPLIKHYTPLPVSTVLELGPRILEFREPGALKVLLAEGPPKAPEKAAAKTRPAAGTSAPGGGRGPSGSASAAPSRAIRPGGSPGGGGPDNRAETMWKISQSLQLHKLFDIDEAELRKSIAQASGAGGQVFNAFASIGLKLRETVVVLCTLDRLLGHGKMSSLLGSDAKSEFVNDLVLMMRQEGVAALREPKKIRETTESILAEMKKLGRY